MAEFPLTGDEKLICNAPEGTVLAREVAALHFLVAPTITFTGTLTTSFPILVTAPISAWWNGEFIAVPQGGAYIEGWEGANEVDLTSVDFGNLAGVGWDGISLNDLSALTSVTAPSLIIANDGIFLDNCPALTTFSVPALRVCGMSSGQRGLGLQNCTALTSLALPVIEYIATIKSNGCTALTTISIGALKGVSGDVNFGACALTQASVDLVLARLVALDGTNGTILYAPWGGNALTVTLSGGTNAAPSVAGAANAAILSGRGITVTINITANLTGVAGSAHVGAVIATN